MEEMIDQGGEESLIWQKLTATRTVYKDGMDDVDIQRSNCSISYTHSKTFSSGFRCSLTKWQLQKGPPPLCPPLKGKSTSCQQQQAILSCSVPSSAASWKTGRTPVGNVPFVIMFIKTPANLMQTRQPPGRRRIHTSPPNQRSTGTLARNA